jgi:hypothetical protein
MAKAEIGNSRVVVVKSPRTSQALPPGRGAEFSVGPVFFADASLCTLFSLPGGFFVIDLWLLQQVIDGAHQVVSGGAQFANAMPGHVFEQAFPARQQGDQHAPTVFATARTAHIAVGLEAVDQLDNTVMFQCQALG